MCRFSRDDCPNYRKVAGELGDIYSQLENIVYGRHKPKLDYTSIVKAAPHAAQTLRFPGMETRLKTISNPLNGTCMWLPQMDLYANWISRAKLEEHHGMLQVTGKPGSGKSTIMKYAYEQVRSSFDKTSTCVASFFFNKRGTSLEHSLAGMFRSLLYQILLSDSFKIATLSSLYEGDADRLLGLHLSDLQDLFRKVFLDQENDDINEQPRVNRTIIFVDAIDECDEPGNRDIAYFFGELTDLAYSIGVRLDVCLSRRDFPTVSLKSCPEIKIEMFTRCDIEHYISRRLDIAGFSGGNAGHEIRRELADKANGVFLWVVLVVDEIIKGRENGRNEKYLLKQIRQLPTQLDSLFTELLDLGKMSGPELRETLRLFQWAILSTSLLRLREWHHILAFIRDEPPKSLAEWKESIYHTETDEQLEKQIRAISRGLVEVKVHPVSTSYSDVDDASSVGAGAGSLDSAFGDSRVVQPIHETVRAFFLGGGRWLSEALRAAEDPRQDIASFSAEGHVAIMRCCFAYLAIDELQQYYEARLKHTQRSQIKETGELISPSLEIIKRRDFEISLLDGAISNGSMNLPLSLGSVGFGSSASSHQSDLISRPRINMTENATTHVTKSVRSAGTDPRSTSATSQMLCEYPALESYAIQRIFQHARLAQDGGANPESIITFIHGGCHWKRWLLLQDEVPWSRSLLSLAVHQRLDTWVEYMVECQSPELAKEEMNNALSFAIRRRRTKAISILAAHGAKAQVDQRLEAALRNEKTRRAFLVAMERRQDRANTNEEALSAVLPTYRTLLDNAIQHGNISYVSDLLKFGVKLRFHDVHTMRFDEACFMPSILKLLLDNGADINEKDKYDRTLAHVAAMHDRYDLLKELVLAGADINAKDYKGLTALHHLAKQIKRVCSSNIQDLISSGANVKEKDSDGRTPLHIIAKKSNRIHGTDDRDLRLADMFPGPMERKRKAQFSMVTELIDAGADINAKTDLGWTLLHYICDQHSDSEIIRCLVVAGADINAEDNTRLAPLHLAVQGAERKCLAKEFIASGANIHAKDAKNRTPMDILLEDYEGCWPDAETSKDIDALVSAGARFDTTHRDTHGWTPLHKAIVAGDWTVAEICATLGTDVNEQDAQGRTALHIACALSASAPLVSDFWVPLEPPTRLGSKKGIELCDRLLRLELDLSRKTVTGLSVLHLAADAGIYGPISTMVERGAKLDERDHLGRTPLYFAAEQGYRTVIAVLLDLGADPLITDNFGISPLQRAGDGEHPTSNTAAMEISRHLTKTQCQQQ